VQRLLGFKPILYFHRICMVAFFYLTFRTTLAPLVLFLQILLENLFKVFLQIVKGIWIRFWEAFSKFEISSPCFKCFSFDLNKTPPGWNSPLRVQEGFTNFCKYQLKEDQIFLDTNWKTYQFWNASIKKFYHEIKTNINHYFKKKFEGWWCGPFALGLIFLPLWH
jgi:hypothetical protein